MKAEESKLTTIFADSKTYEIPKYQRPYSWTDQHTHQLLDDTYDAYTSKEREYFIGSVITIEREKDRKFDVVDGQQRLTTLNLLFAKLKSLINDESAKSELQKRILPINVLTGATEQPRLVLRQQDHAFFRDTVLMGKKCEDTTELTETQLRIIDNLQTIDDFLRDKSEQDLKLYANYLLENVYVVFVRTENLQSAYRLFNVLNARGLPLNNGDLIKNKLFELAEDEFTEGLIDEKWNELEDLITISKLDLFLGHHRTAIKGEKQKQSLHLEYESVIEAYPGTPISFIEDLVKSAKNYNKIASNKFDSEKITRLISSLENVSHDEWIPPLLCFLNKQILDISAESFIDLLDKITYQNWIRRLGKTQRSTIYYNIITLLNKGSQGSIILAKIKEAKNNEEFASFMDGDLYGTAYAYAVLHRLEVEMQDASVKKTFTGTIAIEHILPQKINDKYWTDRFNENDHKQWVHKLGNLTLLSGKKNSSAQNFDFNRKKDLYNKKNQKASFDLTKEVCMNHEWTLEQIKSRHSDLSERVKEIWQIQ
ncbi:MAG TPA: DUF262 domain-containing HNH endonuclease family protein [Ohtaekwangia sp.]|uniref:DUF262 domain-containing protein n=1 Tax=Ohtaekwangia sp. TaxID=2066019 RepID=UPI002F953606